MTGAVLCLSATLLFILYMFTLFNDKNTNIVFVVMMNSVDIYHINVRCQYVLFTDAVNFVNICCIALLFSLTDVVNNLFIT